MQPRLEPQYDSKAGITQMVTNLEGLNALVATRAEAYARGESLKTFYLFGGRFRLENVGLRCNQPDHFAPEAYASIPPVLTKDEYLALKQRLPKAPKDAIGFEIPMHLPNVPAAHVVDPISRRGWTIENCHQFFPEAHQKSVSLKPWVGKSLAFALRELNAKSKDTVYEFLHGHVFVRNPTLIDKSPDSTSMDGQVNAKGWYRDDITAQHIIRAGDIAALSAVQFYHFDTYLSLLEERWERRLVDYAKDWTKTLRQIGFSDVSVARGKAPAPIVEYFTKGLGNSEADGFEAEYVRELPWFDVTTRQGNFQLSDTPPDGAPLYDFTRCNVTVKQIATKLGESERLPRGWPKHLIMAPGAEAVGAVLSILQQRAETASKSDKRRR